MGYHKIQINILITIVLTLFISFSFISCSTDYFTKNKREKIVFDSMLSKKNNETLNKYYSGKLELVSDRKRINGGFYCLENHLPNSELNDLLKNDGYPVTLLNDKLEFILVIERKYNKVGKYTYGGNYESGTEAKQCIKELFAIDLYDKNYFSLVSLPGDKPPRKVYNDESYKSTGDCPDNKKLLQIITVLKLIKKEK